MVWGVCSGDLGGEALIGRGLMRGLAIDWGGDEAGQFVKKMRIMSAR